jgi:hypothetical protein
LFLFFLLATCRLGFSQAITGDILGTVQDSTGAVVPGAKVTLTAVDTGIKWESTSDGSGDYLFAQLKPGHYSLEASKTGLQTVTVSNIELLVGQRPRVDIMLKVGAVTQTINVNAGGVQLLETQTSSVGAVIQQKPIVEIPLNGRDFMQLMTLAPGVQPVLNGSSPATTWTGLGGSYAATNGASVSIAGMEESNISYLLDGIETRNARFGSEDLHPSVDALQEFKMQTDAFSAEYGRSSAIVNMTNKSGTNRLHGDTYEFNRLSNLDANDFFYNTQGLTIPHYVQNNFGATLGGPVRKDKTFFFMSYEGFRSRTSGAGTAITLSQAQWQGNLADNSAGTGIFPTASSFCQNNPSVATNKLRCNNVINPFTGVAFPNNVIPGGTGSLLSPVAQHWQAFDPTPNVAGAANSVAFPLFNYAATPDTRNDFNDAILRMDHALSSKDQLYGSYAFHDVPHIGPGTLPTSGNSYPMRTQVVSMTWNHIFSPNLVNEYRMGYNRGKTFLVGRGALGPNYAATVFGLTNTSTNSFDYGVPQAGMSGYSTPGSSSESIGSFDQDFQWVDNLSLVRGNHNLKLGGDVIRERFWEITDFSGVPSFSFTGTFSGSTMADMLMGIPYTATSAFGNSIQDLRSTYYSMYIQDDWRLRPNFTLNLGFRYEYSQPPWDIHNRTVWFNPAVGNLQYSDLNQVRNGIVAPDHRNFSPRVGFAYSPGFLHDTVVRGAFGIFFATENWNTMQFMVNAPRYYAAETLTSNSTTTPSLFLNSLFPALSAPGSPATPFSRNAGARTPYVEEWNLDVQHTFAKNWLAEVGYLGDRGNHTVMRRNLDAASFDLTTIGGTGPASTLASREPWPQFSGILLEDDGGWATYHALAAKLERRISSGLYVMGSYTWSHCIDLISAEGDQSFAGQDFDVYNKGQCDYNVPQRFVANYYYELPFGKGKQFLGGATGPVAKLVGGWEVTGITTFEMGQFFSASLPGNWMNVGSFTTAVPNKVGPLNNPSRTLLNWWNVNSFEFPGCPPGVNASVAGACSTGIHIEGNAGRDQLEVPGLNNWDLGLMKKTQITERFSLEFRAETFNTWNHAQFSTPSTSYNPTTFGRISGLLVSPRQIQLGLKLSF